MFSIAKGFLKLVKPLAIGAPHVTHPEAATLSQLASPMQQNCAPLAPGAGEVPT